MTKRISAVLIALFLSSVAAVAVTEDGEPEKSPVIVVDGYAYATWQEYFLSDLEASGRRCGTMDQGLRRALFPDPNPIETERLLGVSSGSDCSSSLTNPTLDYDTTYRWTVPVVVHIIMDDACSQGAMTDQNVDVQIDILNEDFQAVLGSNGALGNNVEIFFELASVDEFGAPTSGITRSCNTTWFDDSGSYWNSLAWDPHNYMNVYSNKASGNLGYVPFLPADGGGSFVGSDSDRVVVLFSTFGDEVPPSPYNLGRTTTHEVGHYLGLEHTFGANNGACGTSTVPGCYSTEDLICDTTAEAYSAPGGTCTAGSSCGSDDPVDNYMDYADDVCMNKFTVEQGRRMRCSLQHWRPSLGTIGPAGGSPVYEDDFETGDTSRWSSSSP